MSYMNRWDEYNERKQHVITGLIKVLNRRNACSRMIVLAVLQNRLMEVEQTLKKHRENEQIRIKEELRAKKLAEIEQAMAKDSQIEIEEAQLEQEQQQEQ